MSLEQRVQKIEKYLFDVINKDTVISGLNNTIDFLSTSDNKAYRFLHLNPKEFIIDGYSVNVKYDNFVNMNFFLQSYHEHFFVNAFNIRSSTEMTLRFPDKNTGDYDIYYSDKLSTETSVDELEVMMFEIMVLRGNNRINEIEANLILLYLLTKNFLPYVPDDHVFVITIDQKIKKTLIDVLCEL